MKRFISLLAVMAVLFSLYACGNAEEEKSYYTDTELVELETFTSITGIELNITENYPESNTVSYNYLLDNNADGLGAVLKYEAYLSEYGFEKSDILSDDTATVYVMDEYVVVTGIFYPQSNVIQYVLNIPNEKNVAVENEAGEASDIAPEETEEVQEPEVQIDPETVYSEFCRLVTNGSYTDALEYVDEYLKNGILSVNYSDLSDYYHYAEAMKLYIETELLSYQDILEVVRILTEDVSEGFKDSSEIAEKIQSELDDFATGTYIQKRDSRYYYDAFYLEIKDEGAIDISVGTKSGGISHVQSECQLVYVNLEKSSQYLLCCYGPDHSPELRLCYYVIYKGTDYLGLSRTWNDKTNGTYVGTYTKIS